MMGKIRTSGLVLMFMAFLAIISCAGTQTYQCINTHYRLQELRQLVYRLCYANGLDANKTYVCVVRDEAIGAWVDEKPCIYVTTGFLDAVPGNETVMCMISHELSHYTLKHIHKGWLLSSSIGLAFDVLDVFFPGAGIGNIIVNPVATRTYGRAQELQADENAILLLERTGVENAREEYINMLTWARGYGRGGGELWLWSTHPPLENRIKNLAENKETKTLIAKKEYKDISISVELPQETTYTPPVLKVEEIGGYFLVTDNGIVLHRSTDLEWFIGPDKDMTCYEAKDWADNLSVDGGGWRMPTINELRTLYEAVNKTSGLPWSKFKGWVVWSGELYEKSRTDSWLLVFDFNGVRVLESCAHHASRALATRSRR